MAQSRLWPPLSNDHHQRWWLAYDGPGRCPPIEPSSVRPTGSDRCEGLPERASCLGGQRHRPDGSSRALELYATSACESVCQEGVVVFEDGSDASSGDAVLHLALQPRLHHQHLLITTNIFYMQNSSIEHGITCSRSQARRRVLSGLASRHRRDYILAKSLRMRSAADTSRCVHVWRHYPGEVHKARRDRKWTLSPFLRA